MAGQAALLSRQEVKSTIHSIECNKGSSGSKSGKMMEKTTTKKMK